uniref:Uncharacterized protein n=1 Tax=Rhizophora mucronata TaxID=61149 RepID=A0A2P2QGA3_RHIMU
MNLSQVKQIKKDPMKQYSREVAYKLGERKNIHNT